MWWLSPIDEEADKAALFDRIRPLLARLLAAAVASVTPAGPVGKVWPVVAVARGDRNAGPRKTGRLTADYIWGFRFTRPLPCMRATPAGGKHCAATSCALRLRMTD
jgi:hypothetical protein